MKETELLISSGRIQLNLDDLGFCMNADEGRLMLLELLSKAGAGFYNSHTEEAFLRKSKMMRSDRTPNKHGLRFIRSMLYNHSNYRPVCFELMQKYRRHMDSVS